MKRGTIDHPKTMRLARLLDIERWGAVGILESLWHFTARHAMRGDIGRWPNDEIAEGIGWKGDPDTLVDALVSARWLDADNSHRLIVHDWHEHADDSVKKTLRNRSEHFATFPEKSRNGSPQPEPEPGQSQAVAEATAPPADVVLTFPCGGVGNTWILTRAQLSEWQSCYPTLDVEAECRKAFAWIGANEKGRKTPKGMPRFLVNWLNRANPDTSQRGPPASPADPRGNFAVAQRYFNNQGVSDDNHEST